MGKTRLSISLAHAADGEIISADSMQVYRHMDIGSAKITKEEMDGIPHYLIDVLDPREEFHVVRFQQMAKEAMDKIYAKGKIPILTGGTGFYIQAVVKDIDFSEDTEKSPVRQRLEQEAQEKGSAWMHRISEHNEREAEKTSPYNTAYFVLNDDREKLYLRIDRRVDEMLDAGLIQEVQDLKNMGYTKNMVSMQGLGYKEILSWLDGEITLEEAVYILKRDTRHFAKRQLTWFRREKDVIWVNKPEFSYNEDAILEYMLKICKERGICDAGNECSVPGTGNQQ